MFNKVMLIQIYNKSLLHTHTHTPNFTYYKVKLAIVVKGDLKAPFSLATTPRCREGHYSFLWIAPLYP